MKSKKIFKILSTLSLVLFYLFTIFGILILVMESFYIWKPDSNFIKSWGEFEPIFTYINLNFYQQPEIYSDKSFRALSLVTTATAFLLVNLFLWFMHKLLKNIYADGLFMYENASIIFKLGITTIFVGAVSTYTDGLLSAKALAALDVSNADITFSNLYYMDWILNGIILLIIAAALKTAVHAVEENKKTI